MLSAAVLPWLKATSQCSIRSPGRRGRRSRTRRCRRRRRRPGTGVWRRESTAHAARLADLEPGGAGQPDVGHRADADHHGVGVELEPALGDHAGDAAVGALEAVELVVAVDLDPVLLEPVLEEPPGLLAEPAAERRPARASPASTSCPARSATPRPRWRCTSRRSAPRACRRRRRGSCRCCRACAGSGCPRARRPGPISRRTPAPVASSALSKLTSCSSDSVDGPLGRSSRVTETRGSAPRPAAPRTTRAAGTASPRATPCPGGSPSSTAGGCRAGRARARSAGSPRRRPDSRSQRAQLPAARPPPIST